MIVLWRIATACNLACGFCAYDRRLRGTRPRADAVEIARLGELFGRHRAETGEEVLFSWLGGEPLLWREVLALSRRFRERHGLRTSATTNGTTLHRPGEVEAILASFDELTVSVDGLAATHERLRGWPGGWRRLAEGVRRLADARAPRFRLRANVVLMRDTLPEFAELCGHLADWGMDEITFNQLGGRDRPEFHPAQALRPADIADLRSMLPALVERLASRGVRLIADPAYVERLDATARGRAIAVADCESRRPSLFIDEYGRIAPCSFTLAEYGVPTGSLRTVGDVAMLRARLSGARRAMPAGICADCPSTQVFAKFGT
ncbi:radical SAM protein [Flavobacterium sp. MXW15]|uniref:Radical SAM protein n=1 Tax=Xanthomonas chitinilytica TaxID=2989819 RepID=A0ABT3JY06_9XANT|nr:radical SAM protein [Xanthomonas sp. H13-6]MCW4455535.1 radical SAM protein [Flavobacterium sp. MXW15]MCW4473384.1 radical SAM protein [Xanthomonas sp. H13-6]